eukprot:3182640-Rhodomonas_salina.1
MKSTSKLAMDMMVLTGFRLLCHLRPAGSRHSTRRSRHSTPRSRHTTWRSRHTTSHSTRRARHTTQRSRHRNTNVTDCMPSLLGGRGLPFWGGGLKGIRSRIWGLGPGSRVKGLGCLGSRV